LRIRKIRRFASPIGPKELRATLDRLIGELPEALLVHSSLSGCGWFTAGPDDVLDALVDHCGTLALVTHTYCYPMTPGEVGPLFDPMVTASQNGILTEMFRKRPGAVRSIHATHSLAARGPLAREIVADHYLQDSPCGAGTPYSRLVHRRCSALMFGVSFHYYTFFHTAEFESGSAFAYQHNVQDRLRVIDETGVERECPSRRQNWAPNRFERAGELLEHHGLVRRAKLGRHFLSFVPDCQKVHEFMIGRLREMPDFLRQSCTTALR
jgi:aminoglycoside 3-N-acetyltransferase